MAYAFKILSYIPMDAVNEKSGREGEKVKAEAIDWGRKGRI